MMQSKNNFIRKPMTAILGIFVLCSLVHNFEVLVIKTDQTFFADNFINKVFGIIVLAFCLRIFHLSWRDIGFRTDKLKYLVYGFIFGILCFTAAYGIEYFLLQSQNLAPKFEFFVNGFSLSGEVVKQTGIIAFSLCIVLNIVNVVMEEGIFRGLFIKLALVKTTFVRANWGAAILFGLWHLSMPIYSLINNQMSFGEAAVLGIGYVILATIMGIKWGLWLRNTQCLWFGLSEHFFNNTIGNVLHVTTTSGIDEMQLTRILVAQMLSLAITLVINQRMKQNSFR